MVEEGMKKSVQRLRPRTSHTVLSTMGGKASHGPRTPSFSRDCIPCDIFIFPTMRTRFKGLRFEIMAEIQNVTTAILNHLHEYDFWKCLESWK